MMNNLTFSIDYQSLNKHHEELCGDYVDITQGTETGKVIVLSDGLGSGVKANILSTLCAKMISTMLAKSIPIEECIETMAHTLPVCKVRGLGYSTFTILHLKDDQTLEIINYDNPEAIVLRQGKAIKLSYLELMIGDKRIKKAQVTLEEKDTIIIMSDGCVHAGVGKTLNYGWLHENIVDFMEKMYIESYSSKALTKLLIDECNRLYQSEPGDDTTVLCLRVKKQDVVNLLIGPPQNKALDEKMLSLFFSKKGKHIVCGGTTSQMVSKYLDTPIDLTFDYQDISIPPIARIQGVDLVTEGILTINKVLEYARDYTTNNTLFFDWTMKKDGASELSKLLFEEATNINLYVGKAVNPAHQNPNLPINFSIKMQLIDSLVSALKTMGKTVNINYF